MGKPKGYEIPHPESKSPESKKERQQREKQRMKLVRAALAKRPEELKTYHENRMRSVQFESPRYKGTRGEHKRSAVRDALND